MRQLAAEKGQAGNTPVIISQCSEDEQTCTHYIPLVKGIDFHAGLPETVEHQKVNSESFSVIETLKGGLRVVFPFLKSYIDPTMSTSSVSDDAEL